MTRAIRCEILFVSTRMFDVLGRQFGERWNFIIFQFEFFTIFYSIGFYV